MVVPRTVLKNIGRVGFTLIELSIVLVIIGLIIGGVLVGRDLIEAATIRAQISQIEKYNAAVNTFRGKYAELPGDMDAASCNAFGFSSCAGRGAAGQGDNNGTIEGSGGGAFHEGDFGAAGEVVMFWVDLSTAALIDGGFNTANPNSMPGSNVTGTGIANYLPSAKVGNGNYVYVWSGMGFGNGGNNFGLSAITEFNVANYGRMDSNPGLSVAQAYAIDKKIDDGMPSTGRVFAAYSYSETIRWSAGYPNPQGGSSGTCNDNGSGSVFAYSIEINNGANLNCGLSFEFQ